MNNVIAALIPVGGMLLVLFITQKFELKKRKIEEYRWYTSFYLQKEIDILSELFSAVVDWHFKLNDYSNYPPQTIEEFRQELIKKEEVFVRVKALSTGYLDQEGKAITSQVLGDFRKIQIIIGSKLHDTQNVRNDSVSSDGKDALEIFIDTYEKAVAYFEKKLKPESKLHIKELFNQKR